MAMSDDPGTFVPTSTAERIILTAERLFSERDPDAVSLREVGTEAGQRNSGVVQYHFGDKESLLGEILAFRMESINASRDALLADLVADGRSADLRAIIEAIVLPLATDDHPDTHYVRFLARLLSDPNRRTSFGWPSATSLRKAWTYLQQALPTMPDEVASDRMSMLVNLVIRTIADHEGEEVPTTDQSPWIINLVDAAVGLLTAPITSR